MKMLPLMQMCPQARDPRRMQVDLDRGWGAAMKIGVSRVMQKMERRIELGSTEAERPIRKETAKASAMALGMAMAKKAMAAVAKMLEGVVVAKAQADDPSILEEVGGIYCSRRGKRRKKAKRHRIDPSMGRRPVKKEEEEDSGRWPFLERPVPRTNDYCYRRH